MIVITVHTVQLEFTAYRNSLLHCICITYQYFQYSGTSDLCHKFCGFHLHFALYRSCPAPVFVARNGRFLFGCTLSGCTCASNFSFSRSRACMARGSNEKDGDLGGEEYVFGGRSPAAPQSDVHHETRR